MCNVNCTTVKTKRQSNLGLFRTGVPCIDSKFFQLQNVISHPVFVVCTYCFRFLTSLEALYLINSRKIKTIPNFDS